MIISSYGISDSKSIPTILVNNVLLPVDPSITITYLVGDIPGNETLGTALIIQYRDHETMGELADIVLPNLPAHIVSYLSQRFPITINDLTNNIELQLNELNYMDVA